MDHIFLIVNWILNEVGVHENRKYAKGGLCSKKFVDPWVQVRAKLMFCSSHGPLVPWTTQTLVSRPKTYRSPPMWTFSGADGVGRYILSICAFCYTYLLRTAKSGRMHRFLCVDGRAWLLGRTRCHVSKLNPFLSHQLQNFNRKLRILYLQ